MNHTEANQYKPITIKKEHYEPKKIIMINQNRALGTKMREHLVNHEKPKQGITNQTKAKETICIIKTQRLRIVN